MLSGNNGEKKSATIEICTSRRLSPEKKRVLFYCGVCIGVILIILTWVPGLSSEFGVLDDSAKISRKSIKTSIWEFGLWPEESFIGEAQDFAIEVINLALLDGLLSNQLGRKFAALCLILACFLVGSICALISIAACTFAAFFLLYATLFLAYHTWQIFIQCRRNICVHHNKRRATSSLLPSFSSSPSSR
uniref:Uncharacterized protein n=1 Tax=Aureoumbra lagunensis TaxID=44058 RepID=A0A7S3K2Z1_9STRA|mmetsp:Transcript_2692/g.3674  ORF Transcript_2692/g.3674 Transcript_2692/m.3674 type:complete len:190 (+) Transcript_2692:1-570(+)